MIDNSRYKAQSSGGPLDDPTPEYMNLLGMVFSMCGLMMKVEYDGLHVQCFMIVVQYI